MDFLDPAALARFQFALVVFFHFFFVPMSIGTGLITAINETRYFRSGDPRDAASTQFWAKLFTTTFAIGVASGITMEFSFGTNWADYSRFVGDIFGAPLAAEALLAFFLESTFLGVVLLGRGRVSKKFYLVSTWLVFFGSCLSALWILIANSWMQTPAGAMLAADGSKAVLTDFFAAAFNPSTLSRYSHTVLAAFILGSFSSVALAAYYLSKEKFKHYAETTLKAGVIVAVVSTGLLLVSAHSAAVTVANEQPSKIAMMEGHYNSGTLPLYAVGIVDTENEQVIAPLAIPGGTSFLASNDFSTEYPGLNDLALEDTNLVVEELPVQLVFQSYHIMVGCFGLICLAVLVMLIMVFKKNSKLKTNKWALRLLMIAPLFPYAAIMTGWSVAEFGRQPYVVYPSVSGPEGVELLTNSAISQSVGSGELIFTICMFIAVYLVLFIAWFRLVFKYIKQGPVPVEGLSDAEGSAGGAVAMAKEA